METHSRLPGWAEVTSLSYRFTITFELSPLPFITPFSSILYVSSSGILYIAFGRSEEVELPAKNVERTGILARLICAARFRGLDLRVPRKEYMAPQVAQRLK